MKSNYHKLYIMEVIINNNNVKNNKLKVIN